MYGGAAQSSPAELAKARLSAQNTLYNAALGVALLHTAPYMIDYISSLFS